VNLDRLYDISLKWKLLIPFLFLAAMGAVALFAVSYRFQAQIIHLNEEKRLAANYYYFLDMVQSEKERVISLATLVARNPVIAGAFAARDRDRLMEILGPAYEELAQFHGVEQLHFHVPPATSFLRVHAPARHGDEMEAYRQTINEARKTGRPVGGLEWGVTGFGFRGVVPVMYGGKQVGTVEVGSSFGKSFFGHFQESLDADVAVYVPGEPMESGPMVFASTCEQNCLDKRLFAQVLTVDEAVFRTDTWGEKDVAFIAGPVRNFSGKTAAVVVISVDRSQTMFVLEEYRNAAVIIGLIGLVLSTSFVWFISMVFTKRIGKVVEASKEIAAGHRDTRIETKGKDEIGVMAGSINEMLASLEESRMKVKAYADNLELMVEQRTRALKESEKTYRTLVEHVPLIVYLVMADGTAVFVNRFVEEVIGVPAQRLSGHHEVWTEHIHPDDKARVLKEFDACLITGKKFQSEYRVFHQDGHSVHVWDHAVPVFDRDNQLVRMDGIILDVTARKELQEKTVQAEELEMLGQVSARLAHEIRNPLTSVGGLTRRLLKSFEGSDPRRRKGELIVEEVGRLEKILQMMTAYIEPKSIELRSCDLNDVVTRATIALKDEIDNGGLSVETNLDRSIGDIMLDCALFEKILVSLMKNAFYRMKEKGRIEVTTGKDGPRVLLTLSYEPPFVADDDIEHFFYPFVVDYPFRKGDTAKDIMDVPICKVLIHKHGGIISVSKEKEKSVKITISLPRE